MNTIIRNEIEIIVHQTKPTCLVMMSTYNGANYIYDQIESIINQQSVDITLCIRDDGSNDGTISIIESLIELHRDTILLFKGDNKGIHGSFKDIYEKASSLGSYDYYAFSDQDDIWDLDKIIVAISAMNRFNADFYSCTSRLVDSHNNDLGRVTASQEKYSYYMLGNSKLLTSGAQGCTMVISRKLYLFLFEHGFPGEFGHDTWIPIVAYYFFNSVYDVIPHMSYRQHNESWTGNRKNRIRQFVKETKFYFRGLARYRTIGRTLLDKFDNELIPYDRTVIHAIIGDNMNFFEKRRALKEYNFGKFGFKENLVYRLYYLFH